jgi:endonuclease/exonuclease/phosphatase family metal-dependent hydrolase
MFITECMRLCLRFSLVWLAFFLVAHVPRIQGETFRIATYNVEGYLLAASGTRLPKTPTARAKVRESIIALRPDVLALQEIGSLEALHELQDSLRAEGLALPYSEHVPGFDPTIQVAVLSKFPFAERRSHTNETFLLQGRRFRTSRGIGEVEIQVTPAYTFTLLVAHLKSKLTSSQADEGDIRLEEAKLLREKIDALLKGNPEANLVVAGDLNDTKGSLPVRTIMGRAKTRLVDTRPAERNGDSQVDEANREPRMITWTHYYSREDSYNRVDYIMLSPRMARNWVKEESYVLSSPNWGLGSDHRPVVATFRSRDRRVASE